jgi:long-subunit acyl-CoA synthetase (AMP-forming)
MKTIFGVFQTTVKRFPSRPFLVESGKTWTYADMEENVLQRRQELHQQGLLPNQRYLYKGYNSVGFVQDMLAVSAQHATFVPISPDLPGTTVEAIQSLVQPHDKNICEQALPRGWVAPEYDGLSTILFTSGTTSEPKGVLLSHSNVVSNLDMVSKRIPDNIVSHEDHSYAFLPWFHSYGLVCELLFLMSRGASLVVPERRGPRHLIEEIRCVNPTLLFTVPRFLEKVHQVSKRYWFIPDFLKKRAMLGSKLKYLSVGGARVEASTLSFYRDRWNIPVFQGYGLTETGPMVSLSSLEHALDPNLETSCGSPLDGVFVRVHKDTGELEISSPSVCQGYLGPGNSVWRPSDKFLDDGWFRTGDVMGVDNSDYPTSDMTTSDYPTSDMTTSPQSLVFRHRHSGLWKSPTGKFLDPSHIEKTLLGMKGVEQVAIIGNGKPYIKAVLFLSENNDTMMMLQYVQERLRQHGFQNHEIPQEIIVVDTPFSVQENTLSIKQEPKRHVLESMYYNKL